MANERDKEPSYLLEMLSSGTNINIGLASTALSCALAFKYPNVSAILPLLFFAAGEIVAGLFIPSMSTFRYAVNRRISKERREALCQQLTVELQRAVRGDDPNWDRYNRMVEICDTLQRLAKAGGAADGIDSSRVEDACNDFLSLWLSLNSLNDREASQSEREIDVRIAAVKAQQGKPGADRISLDSALSNLERLKARRQRLYSKKAAIEAAMLSLPDAAEEIFQAATSPGGSDGMGQRLQDAIDRLQLDEEIKHSLEFEDPLEALQISKVTPITQAKAPDRRITNTQ